MTRKFYTATELKHEAARMRAEAIRCASLPRRAWMLDVLTGWGEFARQLVKYTKPKLLVGTDISRQVLRRTRRLLAPTKSATLVRCDARALPFADDSFDAVTGYGGWGDLTLFVGSAGVAKVIREMARCLRSGGKLMLATAELPASELKLDSYIYGKARFLPIVFFRYHLRAAGIRNIRIKRWRPKKSISPAMAEAGLRDIDYEFYREVGIRIKPFEQIWARFGHNISLHGRQAWTWLLLTGQKS